MDDSLGTSSSETLLTKIESITSLSSDEDKELEPDNVVRTDEFTIENLGAFSPEEEEQDDKKSKIIHQEPHLPTNAWLIGGPLGSRNAILVFRSSALANASELSIQSKPAYKLHITYKVLQAESKLLAKLLDCHGVTEVANNSSDFNLLWTGSHPKPGVLRSMAPHQRVNHFPRSYELTRKDRLYKNIERMQHAKGAKHFDFVPQTFIMPTEYKEFCSAHHRVKGPWIVKPVASSRGRGIYIVENPSQVPLEEPVVVAKYIGNPLLIDGHKCDLRLYILVASFDPLLIYLYEEGLVRFATVKYDSNHRQLWNPCMHLCNYSINKYHSDYVKSDDPSAENVGHKWTLSALLRHLKTEGKDTSMLMSQVEDLVIKAILASANSIVSACKMFVPNLNNCFELYGFDILIDETLKPWLLEVNLSPSLGCDTPLDVRLKSAMLADLLTLIGIPAIDPILRPSTSSIMSVHSRHNSFMKMRLGNCRRVHSADGLSQATVSSKKTTKGGRLTASTPNLTAEEWRLVRTAKAQFERRGGFVRLFPAADTWIKYSQYLDTNTGVPTIGPVSAYNLMTNHNYNQLLFTQLFPDIPLSTVRYDRAGSNHKFTPMDRSRRGGSDGMHHSGQLSRQCRYERMLTSGHKGSTLGPKKVLKESRSVELRRQIVDLMRNGKKMTQCEARKTFSRYLQCVLHRITTVPEQEGHVEVVLKFLQKASNYLRTPFTVKVPSHKLANKDRAAMVAKQLNDFLCTYNRETEMFLENLDRPSDIPTKLFVEFLEHARETDLEEVLTLQTLQSPMWNTVKSPTIQGILKCIPNVNPNALKRPRALRKGPKLSPLS